MKTGYLPSQARYILFLLGVLAVRTVPLAAQNPPEGPPGPGPPPPVRTVPAAPPNLPALIKQIQPSVVTVIAYDGSGKTSGQGTGFFVSEEGHLITNQHVVDGATKVQVRTSDGSAYALESLVGQDVSADLAYGKAELRGNKAAPLRVSVRQPDVGESIVVVGSPLWLEQTVSAGIVSAVDRELGGLSDMFQITAPTSAGSSGSPVVDLSGQVVGVVTLQVLEGQNLNFAIPGRAVMRLLFPRERPDEPPIVGEETWRTAMGLFRQRKHGEALPHLKAVSEANPQFVRAWRMLAICLAELRRVDELERVVARLREMNPDNPFSDFVLGDTYAKVGNYDAAIEVFRKHLEKRPKDGFVLLRLGQVLGDAGRNEEALQVLTEVAQATPDRVEVHLALGGAYSRLGRHADAKASFIRAIQMRPDSTDGHYGLGMAYIALGRRDLALDEYKMLRPLDETLAGRLFAALYGE